MKNATMLYKSPGPHEIHGGHFDYTIVDADEEGAIEQAQADGWFLTTDEAKEAGDKIKSSNIAEAVKVARAELEAKAKDLGVKFTKRTTDDELVLLISAKEDENSKIVVRAELEAKAKDLGIEFSDETTDDELVGLIDNAGS